MNELDDLASPWPAAPARRDASPAEEQRFRDAFADMLRDRPDRAPGPRALADAMGWSGRQLNGRTSRLRRRLLAEAGFTQDYKDRWVRRC